MQAESSRSGLFTDDLQSRPFLAEMKGNHSNDCVFFVIPIYIRFQLKLCFQYKDYVCKRQCFLCMFPVYMEPHYWVFDVKLLSIGMNLKINDSITFTFFDLLFEHASMVIVWSNMIKKVSKLLRKFDG